MLATNHLQRMKSEHELSPLKAWVMLLIMVIYIVVVLVLGILNLWFFTLYVFLIPILRGFRMVNPREALIIILCGNYSGTIKKNGCFWINPFSGTTAVSMKYNNFTTQIIKVNDKLGNPITIGAVVVWVIRDVYAAAFNVEDYHQFVSTQSEAALRQVASSFPYDNFEEDTEEICLLSGNDQVNIMLRDILNTRLEMAGIEAIEGKISHLAYSKEIAASMLQRQEATAIIAAKRKIVEGAVGMVDLALRELNNRGLDLSEELKSKMVSNLLVVLCSDKAVTPTIELS